MDIEIHKAIVLVVVSILNGAVFVVWHSRYLEILDDNCLGRILLFGTGFLLGISATWLFTTEFSLRATCIALIGGLVGGVHSAIVVPRLVGPRR
jgi:hypothetical protein